MSISPYTWGQASYVNSYPPVMGGYPWPSQSTGYTYPSIQMGWVNPVSPQQVLMSPQGAFLPEPRRKPRANSNEAVDELLKNLITRPVSNLQKPHDHNDHAPAKPSKLKSFALAGGFILGALLLHRLPVRNLPKFPLISADWKDWARIIMGILAVGKINEGFNFKPPPWLGAIEAVAVINPLTMGFTRRSLGQMLVMAPIVAGVVQGANVLNEASAERLKERYGIPKLLTRLAISAAMVVLGVKVYPPVLRKAAQFGVLGQAAKVEAQRTAGNVFVGTEALVCARGCCPSVLCLSEIGEMVGAFGSWFKTSPHQPASARRTV